MINGTLLIGLTNPCEKSSELQYFRLILNSFASSEWSDERVMLEMSILKWLNQWNNSLQVELYQTLFSLSANKKVEKCDNFKDRLT